MIKKEIVELIMNEDTDDLGVNIISLVYKPAIGVKWITLADNDIHSVIIEMASNELIGEVYDPEKVLYVDLTKQQFTSIKDYLKGVLAFDILGKLGIKKEQKPELRFKYTGPSAERNFCKAMLRLNKIYTKEEINDMSKKIDTGFRHKGQAYSLFDFKGGVNCKHYWEELSVFKNDDGTMVFVSHGRAKGKAGEIASASNNFWRYPLSDITNFQLESITDYPKGISEAAKKAVKWADENGWGSCGTAVGKTRASQLANGEPISIDTVKRMYSYLSRHKIDLESSKSYEDGCGKLMYDAWGGEPALSWSERILNQIEKEKMKFSTDEDKRIVVGPVMIPDLPIKRQDPITKEIFYVYFSEDTIKKASEKFFKTLKVNNTDIQHSEMITDENTLLESWIIENPEHDKSKLYGYDLPKGTWMVSYRINNNDTWKSIKSGELNGFSIDGNFIQN